jgi:acyl-CoA thioesterase-1
MNKKILLASALTILAIIFFVYKYTDNEPIPKSTSQKEVTLGTTLTIVAFGDSLTAGYGVPLRESYPALLEQELRQQNILAKVINMGVSGETTDIALERLNFVNEQNPDLILLGLGANDMLRGLPPKNTKANLEKMIVYFKEKNRKVILLGMKSTASNGVMYKTSFDAIYPELAKKYSLPLVPFFLEGVALKEALNTSDGIHPNFFGYQKIVSENVLPVLIPNLKQDTFK